MNNTTDQEIFKLISEEQLTELIDRYYRAYTSPAGEEYHRACIRAIVEAMAQNQYRFCPYCGKEIEV